MNKLTETMFQIAPFGVFTTQEVAAAFPGSPDKRYGLVKRALADGQIVHLRRGLYGLAEKYRRCPLNMYAVAQHIYGPSYISLESALSFHGWIPEAVYTVTSTAFGTSRDFDTPLGMFSYSRVPQKVFYAGVERHVDAAGAVFLMATALKALADYVYVYKKDWTEPASAMESLRIEPEAFDAVLPDEMDAIIDNYTSRRVKRFLTGLRKELFR